MKKVLAIILCAALLLTAAACSKKEESTEAPVTEVQTTAPATQPQTTLPETTQPPTTEAPTEPAPKIDPNAKVIMCSDQKYESMIMMALKKGAKDFVIKPFHSYDILLAVKKIFD